MTRSLSFVVLLLSCCSISNAGDSCSVHANEVCNSPKNFWTTGPCNSVYGGIRGNMHNLKVLAMEHFQDSFKYLIMASYFNTDEMNRLGFHKLIQGYSSTMWSNGKDLIKYLLKRGGVVDSEFVIPPLDFSDYKGEVAVLSSTLDMMKKLTEDTVSAYKHSKNKVKNEVNPEKESYDPDVAHFLEDKLIEPYSQSIRSLAGHLNNVAKIARNDNTKSLGFHLYDTSLL